MRVLDYEKAVLSVILRFPNSNELIPEKIMGVLSDDKFGENGDAHKFIFRAIENCILNQKPPTIINVSEALGQYLELVGGRKYIESLYHFLPTIGEQTNLSWQTFAEIVNRAGRLRHLGLVVDKYAKTYQDFDQLVSQLRTDEEVDNFFNNFLTSMNQEIEGLDTGYKHISTAVTKELDRCKKITDGHIDVEDFGLPSLVEFGIPWRPSFGVIIGLKSSGKTQAAFQMALGKAFELKEKNKPGKVALNSLETVDFIITQRLACPLAKIDSKRLRLNQLSKNELDRYYSALSLIHDLPIVYNDTPNISTQEMTIHAIALNLREGRVLGVSDYAELFRDAPSGSEEQRVASVSRNIKTICRLTSSVEIMISQVNNTVLHKADKIAGIDNARYSGAIGQAADWAIEVWNPIYMIDAHLSPTIPEGKRDDKCYWLIEKNKGGPLGDIQLNWYPQWTRFEDEKCALGQLYTFQHNRPVVEEKVESIWTPGNLTPDF